MLLTTTLEIALPGGPTVHVLELPHAEALWRPLLEAAQAGDDDAILYIQLHLVEAWDPEGPLAEFGSPELFRILDHYLHTDLRTDLR